VRPTLVSYVFAISLLGCQKNPDKPDPSPNGPTASNLVVATAEAPIAMVATKDPNASNVPVEEDFEQKAEATINASTVSQELDKLGKEIGQ
jgi:hypothetical protein